MTRSSATSLQARSSHLVRRVASRFARRIVTGVGAGLRFSIDETGLSYLLGTNEKPVQEALAEHLRPGDVFYDIGANLGFFTVIGGRLTGPGGRVYAFEPVPESAATIRKNVRLNRFDHVEVLERAVSHTSGSGELLLVPHVGGATLSTTSAAPPDVTGRVPVELVSIDDLVDRGVIQPPAVVKIDVEGAELDVLRGMAHTLDAHHPTIVYEVDGVDPQRLARKADRLRSFLADHGYDVRPLADSYPGARSQVLHAVATPAGSPR